MEYSVYVVVTIGRVFGHDVIIEIRKVFARHKLFAMLQTATFSNEG